MVTFPIQRSVQMAPPEADFSGFSEIFKIAPVLYSQKLPCPRGDNPTPSLTSLNPNREAHGVVDCIQELATGRSDLSFLNCKIMITHLL